MARPAGPTLWLSKHSRLSPRTRLVAAALATLLVWTAHTLLAPSTSCRHSTSAASCGDGPASALEPGPEGSVNATTERMELWLPQGSSYSFRTPRSRCVVHPNGKPPLHRR
jgi:hypothetical protein